MSNIIEDIVSDLQDVYNWLQGLANPVEDSLGTLGAWLASGLDYIKQGLENAFRCLSDAFNDAWKYLSDNFKSAYNTLSNWIGSGLQWIGSGISYVGQHLYSFGQWIWNGLLWIGRTVVSAVEGFINWVWQKIVNIWNSIGSTISGFTKAMNDYINNWIEQTREKFVNVVSINVSLDSMFKGIDNLHRGKWKRGLAGIFLSPLIGAIAGCIFDAITPRPHTTRVVIFPELDIPTLTFEPITLEKPPIPSEPSPIELPKQPLKPTNPGYTPNISYYGILSSDYNIEVKSFSGTIKSLGSNLISDYFITIKKPEVASEGNSLISNYFITFEKEITVTRGSNVVSGYGYLMGQLKEVNKGSNLISDYFITVNIPIVSGEGDKLSSGYTINVVVPKNVKKGNSIISGYTTYVSSSGYNVTIYESFES